MSHKIEQTLQRSKGVTLLVSADDHTPVQMWVMMFELVAYFLFFVSAAAARSQSLDQLDACTQVCVCVAGHPL